MKPFISLCMIVKNEEKVLQRCLESIKDVVDEIIIVDTGSFDKTEEIALHYVDKVYNFKWTNSFSDARNFAQSKATGEWILVMDADEYVDSNNLKEVVEDLKLIKQDLDAFEVKIFNFTGTYGERIVQHKSLRIYKNTPSVCYERAVHEQIIKKDDELIVDSCNLILYHSGYLSKIVKEKNKSERNTALIEQEMKVSGHRAFDYFNLGNEYLSLGETEKALDAYVNAYKKKPDFRYSWVSFCLIQIINCLLKLKKYDDGLQVITDAETIYNQSPDFQCLKANIYMEQHRYDDAIEVLDEILIHQEKYQNPITSIDFNEYHPHQMLASIYEEKQDNEKAVYHSVKALNVNSHCRKSLYILLKILLKNSEKNAVYSFIEENKLIRNDNDLYSIIKIFLNLNENELALKYIQKLENQPAIKQGYIMKADLNKGNVESLVKFFETSTVEDLSEMINYGCVDIFDLITFALISKQRNISNLLYQIVSEENLKTLIYFLINRSDEIIIPKQEDMIKLMERTIQLNQFELFEELVGKLGLFDKKIYLDLGHLLYKYKFTELAVAFYQELTFADYDDQAYCNIIEQFIKINEFEDTLQYAFSAIKNNIIDFRIFQFVIDILEKQGLTSDLQKVIELALTFYPDSNWLKERVNFIENTPIKLMESRNQKNKDLDSSPVISIVIPAYNAEKYIQETIESALAQTIADKEIIIVNDGSTDNTLNIIKEYSDVEGVKIYDNVVNRGANYTYNYGVMQAKGRYITFLDADDIFLPTYCERVIEKIELKNADMGFANLFSIEGTKKLESTLYGCPRDPRFQGIFGGPTSIFPDQSTLRKLVLKGVHVSPRSIYKLELFKAFGLEDYRLKIAHDWLRHIRFIINGAKCVFVDQPLGYYRIHPEGNSQKSALDNAVENTKLLEIVVKELAHLMGEEELYISRSNLKQIRNHLFSSLANSDWSTPEIVQFLTNKGLHI
jgi:glycosyltransferase involved in cell wall biosynthesis